MEQNEIVRWGEARYYTLDYYLKSKFGHRLYKLPLSGGMSCPNRDGTIDTRGCIFCASGGGETPWIDERTSSAEHTDQTISQSLATRMQDSVLRQIEYAKQRLIHKSGATPAPAYIAYFQSYTNTHPPKGVDPIVYLRSLFLPAISHPDVAILSIATRPDCLDSEICDLLGKLAKIKPVWVELGFQTAHEETARWMRRGYPNSVFEHAVTELHRRGIPVIVHLILGLGTETKEDMIQTVRYLNRFHPEGVKFHLLHILEHTDLAKEYLATDHKYQQTVLSEESYIDCLLACLAELSPQTVVHRITGDGSKEHLIAPHWSLDKKNVLNHIRHEMKAQDIWQGKYYQEKDFTLKG